MRQTPTPALHRPAGSPSAVEELPLIEALGEGEGWPVPEEGALCQAGPRRARPLGVLDSVYNGECSRGGGGKGEGRMSQKLPFFTRPRAVTYRIRKLITVGGPHTAVK